MWWSVVTPNWKWSLYENLPTSYLKIWAVWRQTFVINSSLLLKKIIDYPHSCFYTITGDTVEEEPWGYDVMYVTCKWKHKITSLPKCISTIINTLVDIASQVFARWWSHLDVCMPNNIWIWIYHGINCRYINTELILWEVIIRKGITDDDTLSLYKFQWNLNQNAKFLLKKRIFKMSTLCRSVCYFGWLLWICLVTPSPTLFISAEW